MLKNYLILMSMMCQRSNHMLKNILILMSMMCQMTKVMNVKINVSSTLTESAVKQLVIVDTKIDSTEE
jgi:hypothetical protein